MTRRIKEGERAININSKFPYTRKTIFYWSDKDGRRMINPLYKLIQKND